MLMPGIPQRSYIWINQPVGEAKGLGFSEGGLLLREVSGTARRLPMRTAYGWS